MEEEDAAAAYVESHLTHLIDHMTRAAGHAAALMELIVPFDSVHSVLGNADAMSDIFIGAPLAEFRAIGDIDGSWVTTELVWQRAVDSIMLDYYAKRLTRAMVPPEDGPPEDEQSEDEQDIGQYL